MISRKLAGVSAATVGAATAVSALLLGSVAGSAAESSYSSAFGIAAYGLLPIDPTPFVQYTGGEDAATAEDTSVEVPEPLSIRVLSVSAGPEGSSAKAVDVDLGGGDLGEDGLHIEVLTATCADGVGDVQIIGGVVNDDDLPESPLPEDAIDLSPLVNIDFDRQTTNEDGSLTVDALVLTLLPGTDAELPLAPADLDQLHELAPGLALPAETPDTVGDLEQAIEELNPGLDLPGGDGPLLEIVISSATCAKDGKKVPPAPIPTPTTTNLPVTH